MSPASAPVQQVWDRLVRCAHWTLVLAVAVAWYSTWRNGDWHEPAGYLALAVVLLRLVWGFIGSPYARLAQFVRAPAATLRYAGFVLHRREPRYIGHNPLGGWMVLALMGCVAGLALSGWLYRSERFWGDETVERVHVTLAWGMLVLIALHIVGVVFTSLRHRENLVRSMLTGRKRAAQLDDVA